MRYSLGLFPLALAPLFWAASLLVDPYTSYGWETELVRPGIAEISGFLAIITLLLLIIAAVMLFWAEKNRRGAKAIIVTTILLFFGTTMIARLAWLQFFVLT